MDYPVIIQGGMGAGVSGWRLARTVSRSGQLGVVSGTALDQVMVRRLQDGDPGGNVRYALENFPGRDIANKAIARWFRPGGRNRGEAYARLPQQAPDGPRETWELCILANYVEIFLARQGHDNPVGINYLEKIQLPQLASIYGAMLAGVGYILMGAGIPLKIPGAMDAMARHEEVTYPLAVTGAEPGESFGVTFRPGDFVEVPPAPFTRPKFLAIVSSNTLAATMLKRATGRVDGFIVEAPIAGGHNAPPRGKLQLDAGGESVYGERDVVDIEKFRELNRPFWLAGGYGRPERLREALAAGAAGVQVGTAFAFCEESGLDEPYKRAVLESVWRDELRVTTDALASPTGFPFKVVPVNGSLSDPAVYQARPRICDLGYLREAYRTADGTVGFRCAAEPLTTFVAKGGNPAESSGRKCLCNALMANIGLAQHRNGNYVEHGLVTAGNDVDCLRQFAPAGGQQYTAEMVLEQLLAGLEEAGEQRKATSHGL